jgi:hypothetical protein
VEHIRTFNKTSLRVLYLGTLYNASALPWHYSLVMFLATTPVLFLLTALASLASLLPGRRATHPGAARAAILGWLWWLVPVAAEMRAPMRYDGVRHLLMATPGFCLTAGVGLSSAFDLIAALARSTRARRLAGAAVALAIFGGVGVELIQAHPYENAYLNEATNAVLPGPAEDLFEVEYWCQTYQEGARWLNANAEPDARIYVGLDPACAEPYLTKPPQDMNTDTLAAFDSRTPSAYFMVMTRRAMYNQAIDRVRRGYEPVFRIRRQRGTLLEIYSNRIPAKRQPQ